MADKDIPQPGGFKQRMKEIAAGIFQPYVDTTPWTSSHGVAGIAFTSADAQTAAAVTDAPTTGQKLVITDIIASSDTAMFLIFHEESTAGTVIFKVFLPANGTVHIRPRSKVKLPTVNKKLMVDASAAGNIAVTVCYYSEA